MHGQHDKKEIVHKTIGDLGGALANTQKKMHKRWHTIPSRCLSVSSCPGYLFVVSAVSFSIRRILGRVILKSSSETTGLDEILMNVYSFWLKDSCPRHFTKMTPPYGAALCTETAGRCIRYKATSHDFTRDQDQRGLS